MKLQKFIIFQLYDKFKIQIKDKSYFDIIEKK